ncbi:MAG: hypothetical protein JO353_12735 [Phycisphaerae bacterium]|nr:hypothetical protein [Phycisphaerae bacterium]
MRLTSDSTGTSVTLAEPHANYSKTFNAATASANASSITDDIKHNLSGEFTGLQKSVDQTTGIGVVDGNPHAVTAILADDAYTNFGLNAALPAAPSAQIGAFTIGATAGGGMYRTGGLDADFATLDLTFGMRLGNRVGLVFSDWFEYGQVGGDSRYLGGTNTGLPISIILPPAVGASGIAWQITPWASLGGGGDPDLVLGGGVAGGGATSVVRLIHGPLSLSIIDQGSYDTGFNIHVDGYHFDDKVDQWIVKNGVIGAYTVSNGFFVDAGASYTDFLNPAGVRDYLSPTAGIGIAWGAEHESSFRVAYEGDFGHGFNANGASLQLRLGF